LLIVERNTSVGNVPMCSASQTAFSTFSDQLLESANLRKIQIIGEKTGSKTVWMRFSGQSSASITKIYDTNAPGY